MTALLNPSPAYALGQPGALEIRGLNKHYRIDGKPLQVLSGIDLQVLPGEFVCIVGASGCGKSSLLRLIVGLEQDYEGLIRLDGEIVRGTSLDRGLVFQDHRLFPWKTVEQNVALALKNQRLGKREKVERVAEHLALVGLQGFEQAYPHQLSGGMAQRAAIARALITRPKLLLLDEPFGALDALTRVNLQRELQRIWLQQRSSVIMVTHDVEEALYLGDRVIVMDARPGRIRHEVRVELPHPRERNAPRLHRLRDELLAELTGQ
ncbi:NitT/TauT family transport system ATP-binding protein/sulfonate transport system ATP-binding protein [Pseudomonas citronellolis]|uniref:NitT/TauT family transport system ATP-binding protein/sulfonate transport system ATP-binding protein n=1 Tax=Pseudomonas citronellolis TaxID=53408 RepID=A0AAQ1HNR8_9PSED|nr:ABC transporter ATP-binding protein [Pseudomonas citronellolis]TGC32616.1 ABC transporter ATP-binding protein [Pseudomonas citronellolis]SFD03956.1 NitT/TauT family transport system ATP-binding protein/sulfonate transport system ATP-binding protein [Pseudomonas citronellolis]